LVAPRRRPFPTCRCWVIRVDCARAYPRSSGGRSPSGLCVLLLWVRAYLNANRKQLRKALLGDLRPLLASAISLPVLSGFLAGIWVRFNLSGFLLLAYLVGVASGVVLYCLLAPRKSWVSQVLTHLREAPPSPHTKPAES